MSHSGSEAARCLCGAARESRGSGLGVGADVDWSMSSSSSSCALSAVPESPQVWAAALLRELPVAYSAIARSMKLVRFDLALSALSALSVLSGRLVGSVGSQRCSWFWVGIAVGMASVAPRRWAVTRSSASTPRHSASRRRRSGGAKSSGSVKSVRSFSPVLSRSSSASSCRTRGESVWLWIASGRSSLSGSRSSSRRSFSSALSHACTRASASRCPS